MKKEIFIPRDVDGKIIASIERGHIDDGDAFICFTDDTFVHVKFVEFGRLSVYGQYGQPDESDKAIMANWQ